MQIEQAVFTSARTQRSAGYQLVAVSPGVSESDARELSIWGPSHDSLSDDDPAAESVNFHHLPSGAYCVSKTLAAGSEYSERGGRQIYTQCLVVPAPILARFGNNPFALLSTADAQGSLEVHRKVPRTLEPIRLSGCAKFVDEHLLAQLADEWGADQLGMLIKETLEHRHLGLAVGARAPSLIAGLLNCFPVECRTRFSFSTGLKCSPRRPFRIVRLPADDPVAVRRFRVKHRIAVWDPKQKASEAAAPHEGWPGLIATLMRSGDVELLAERLSHPRPGLSVGDLELLGNRLCGQIAVASHHSSSSKGSEPLDDSPTTLAELTNHLRRHPSSEPLWTRWVKIHEECLDRRDNEAAAVMVLKACQIFGVHSHPEPRLVRRVESLLQQQWHRDPQLFRHTLSRLAGLKPVFGRDHWLHLAHRIAERESGGESAPRATPESADVVDGPGRFSRDPVARDPVQSDGASDRVAADEQPVVQRQEGAHQTAGPIGETGAMGASTAAVGIKPSKTLGAQCPQAVEMLELLDDKVFDAIAGKPNAAEELQTLWSQVVAQLGEEMIEESKQEYLRHALGVWRTCSESAEDRDATRAAVVVDVISILMSD